MYLLLIKFFDHPPSGLQENSEEPVRIRAWVFLSVNGMRYKASPPL
jgi:hypothetical protein